MSEQGSLTPLGYRPRIVDERVDKLLKSFGGLEITGAKWCGKTWTALAHAKSYDSLMEATALDAARTDPSLVLMGDEPHLVDEWQEVPAIWDAARNHIDRNANRKGELILTGSARPKDEGRHWQDCPFAHAPHGALRIGSSVRRGEFRGLIRWRVHTRPQGDDGAGRRAMVL